MSINSNTKGKAGERELAAKLSTMFRREVFRSQQYCGANHDADLLGLPGIHIECKRVESMDLYRWLKQAWAEVGPPDVAAVFHRRNKEAWIVSVALTDLPDFVEALAGLFDEADMPEFLKTTQEPDA